MAGLEGHAVPIHRKSSQFKPIRKARWLQRVARLYYLLYSQTPGGAITKVGIANPDALRNPYNQVYYDNEFGFDEAVNVSAEELNQYPNAGFAHLSSTKYLPANGQNNPDGKLITDGTTVAIVSNGQKRQFTSQADFLNLGYKFCNLILDSSYTNYPLGPNVTLPGSTTPSLAVTGGPLTFNYQIGSAAPGAQNLQGSLSSGSLGYTATSNSSWLQVSPASGTLGTTATTLSVSVLPGSLGVGTYNGTITVSVSGASGSPQVVNVTFNVTPAATLPVFTTGPIPGECGIPTGANQFANTVPRFMGGCTSPVLKWGTWWSRDSVGPDVG